MDNGNITFCERLCTVSDDVGCIIGDVVSAVSAVGCIAGAVGYMSGIDLLKYVGNRVKQPLCEG